MKQRLIDANALIEYCNNLVDKAIDANDIARFPTAVGWISTKDRMPNSDDGVVLAIAEYDDGWCEVLAWRSEKTGWTSDDPLFQDGMEVTYWMPLPEPPQEVTGDE